MTDNEVQRNEYYTYKDNTYVVVACDELEMKSPSDGNWYPAVAYAPVDEEYNPLPKAYIRTLEDFKEKFKPVSPNA